MDSGRKQKMDDDSRSEEKEHFTDTVDIKDGGHDEECLPCGQPAKESIDIKGSAGLATSISGSGSWRARSANWMGWNGM